MNETIQDEAELEVAPILFAEFLETQPPNSPRDVSDVREAVQGRWFVSTPDLQLHCSDVACGGTRFFEFRGNSPYFHTQSDNFFLKYVCRNCDESFKTFAIDITVQSGTRGVVTKYGELPTFGPPTPSRLISLVGPDRDAFLKGRRAEIQGLGIGAFAYYRRVVENQKDRIIDEILRVSTHLGAKAELKKAFENAKKEIQFTKAIELVGGAIPPSLLINGHNPLTLLHKALSKGLHAKSDADCLSLATSIRIVLEELTERSAAAMKDHAELRAALSTLMNDDLLT